MTEQEARYVDRLPRRARFRIEAVIGAGAAVIVAAAVASAASSPSPAASDRTGAGAPWDALAIPLDGHHGPRGGFGLLRFGTITITAIDGNELSLETDDGWTRTIEVTDETEISKDGEDATLADLAVGDAVRFRQSADDDGTFTIDALAVVLPRIAGEVTAIDGSTVTINRPDGSVGTINIGADTDLRVEGDDDATVADIEVGMVIIAAGKRNADGSIEASRAVAGDAIRRGWHGPRLDRDGTNDGTTDAG